jgi:hypothetical protein
MAKVITTEIRETHYALSDLTDVDLYVLEAALARLCDAVRKREWYLCATGAPTEAEGKKQARTALAALHEAVFQAHAGRTDG